MKYKLVDRDPDLRIGTDQGELVQAQDRVLRMALEELQCLVDRPAVATVLVAPIGPARRSAWEIEVEVCDSASRAGRPAEDNCPHIGYGRIERCERRSVGQKLAHRPLPVP